MVLALAAEVPAPGSSCALGSPCRRSPRGIPQSARHSVVVVRAALCVGVSLSQRWDVQSCVAAWRAPSGAHAGRTDLSWLPDPGEVKQLPRLVPVCTVGQCYRPATLWTSDGCVTGGVGCGSPAPYSAVVVYCRRKICSGKKEIGVNAFLVIDTSHLFLVFPQRSLICGSHLLSPAPSHRCPSGLASPLSLPSPPL